MLKYDHLLPEGLPVNNEESLHALYKKTHDAGEELNFALTGNDRARIIYWCKELQLRTIALTSKCLTDVAETLLTERMESKGPPGDHI